MSRFWIIFLIVVTQVVLLTGGFLGGVAYQQHRTQEERAMLMRFMALEQEMQETGSIDPGLLEGVMREAHRRFGGHLLAWARNVPMLRDAERGYLEAQAQSREARRSLDYVTSYAGDGEQRQEARPATDRPAGEDADETDQATAARQALAAREDSERDRTSAGNAEPTRQTERSREEDARTVAPSDDPPPEGAPIRVVSRQDARRALLAPPPPRDAPDADADWPFGAPPREDLVHMVQTGFFAARESAQALERRLAAKGYETEIQGVEQETGGLWYTLGVGSYTDARAAERAAEAFRRAEGIPAWVNTLPAPAQNGQ